MKHRKKQKRKKAKQNRQKASEYNKTKVRRQETNKANETAKSRDIVKNYEHQKAHAWKRKTTHGCQSNTKRIVTKIKKKRIRDT